MRRALEALILLVASALPGAADIAFVTCQNGDMVTVLDLKTGASRTWDVPGKPAGVAVAPDGAVFTVSPDSAEVRRFAPDGSIEATATLEGGPVGIALDAARGQVFISDWYNARVWVLDARDLTLKAELQTGAAPAGLALSPGGHFLASADRDANQVSLFDARTMALIARHAVGERPFGLRFAPDGRLFVANVGSNDVTVLHPETGDATTVPVGERPYGVAFAAGRAFVSNQYADTVSVIDLVSLEHLATIEVGEYPEGIDSSADGRHVAVVNWFDNTLNLIDANTLTVVSEYATGDGPRAFGTFILGGDWE